MLIYLDTNIVIYAVENPAVFGASAQARLQAISRSDHIALSPVNAYGMLQLSATVAAASFLMIAPAAWRWGVSQNPGERQGIMARFA